MHCVIETEAFRSSADDLGMSDDERQKIIGQIASDPKKGDLIKGTGGARKYVSHLRGKEKVAVSG